MANLMEKINWRKARWYTLGVLVIAGIMCAIFEEGILNGIFATIGGISFVGLIISLLMCYREKALQKKAINFTCKSCGKYFVWNEENVTCDLVHDEIDQSGNCTFYHYTINVTWTCECGNKNTFTIRLSSREPASMLELVHQYYLGQIVN